MRHDPPALMLFAAGFGTRMRALTAHQPKPLISVAGKPLIDHALTLATGVGADPIVANTHYLPQLLEGHLADTPVQTVREAPEILDTGGGLHNALPLLGRDTVVTLNSDAVWSGQPDRDAARRVGACAYGSLLICVPMAQVHGRLSGGDFDIDQNGRLHRGCTTVYGGVQILKTDLLHEVAETVFFLNVVWNMMAQNNRLFGLRYPGHWCDVGHPGGIAEAEQMLADTRV